MKWGVRRYQNYDGTRIKKGESPVMSEDAARYQALKQKSVSEMSNRELQEYNTRANLERQYQSYQQSGKSSSQRLISSVQNKLIESAANEVSKGISDGTREVITAAVGTGIAISLRGAAAGAVKSGAKFVGKKASKKAAPYLLAGAIRVGSRAI